MTLELRALSVQQGDVPLFPPLSLTFRQGGSQR